MPTTRQLATPRLLLRPWQDRGLARIALLSLLIGVVCIPTNAGVQNTNTAKIQIRIVDGRNGKPLRAQQLLVHLNHLDTTRSGIIDVQVDPNETLQIVDLYSLYRCEVRKQSNPYVAYSTHQVLETGLVSPNHCGKQTTKPTPGVLVLYMRPRHSWESMRDFGTLMKDATIH